MTAENHTVIGGLGGAICEELAASWPVPVVRVGVPDRFGEVGKMAGLHRIMGMDVVDIAAAARKAVSMKRI